MVILLAVLQPNMPMVAIKNANGSKDISFGCRKVKQFVFDLKEYLLGCKFGALMGVESQNFSKIWLLGIRFCSALAFMF